MKTTKEHERPVVLITGCSSGIGLLAAKRFARAGYRVFASMRRPDDAGELRTLAATEGWALTTPALDVTSDASVATAVGALLGETGGRIDVLVNNAGYYLYGPIEETSPDELRAVLETNVVGVLRVTRAVLPAMRAAGRGAVVTISSVSGRVVVPVSGPYHISKWALEALVEALRYEMIPFGIRITCIEPGSFATDLHVKERRVEESRKDDSPYAALMAAYARNSDRMHRGPAFPVVDAILRAAEHPNPPLRCAMGPASFLGTVVRRFTPDRVYEWVMQHVFALRRRRT